jgi:hypothetical protein
MFRIFLFNSVRTTVCISVIPIPAIYHLMLTYHSTFTQSAFFLTTIIYQGSLFYILLYSTMAASYVLTNILYTKAALSCLYSTYHYLNRLHLSSYLPPLRGLPLLLLKTYYICTLFLVLTVILYSSFFFSTYRYSIPYADCLFSILLAVSIVTRAASLVQYLPISYSRVSPSYLPSLFGQPL